jgi:hypothetical protein
MALYAWNAQIAAAFMYPLHFCEVMIRNAVSEVLTVLYGFQWPWDQGFLLSLPDPAGAKPFKPRQAVLAARFKAEQSAKDGAPSTDKAIAEMSFAFWESMFTARFDHGLWTNHLKAQFPNAPVTMKYYELRSAIKKALENLRRLRNRIAHHEPIFTRALEQDYSQVLRLLAYRCKHTADWVDETQSVRQLLLAKP